MPKIGALLALAAAAAFLISLVWGRLQWKRRRVAEKEAQENAARLEKIVSREEDRFRRWVALLAALHEKGVSPTGRVSWTEWADRLVEAVRSLLDAEKVILVVMEVPTREWRGISAAGISPEHVHLVNVRPGEGVFGHVLQNGRALAGLSNKAPAPLIPQEGFLSLPYFVWPLTAPTGVVGLLAASAPRSGTFVPQAEILGSLLASEGAQLFQNLSQFEAFQQSCDETVEALASALEAKDPDERKHAERVRLLVRETARALELPAPLVKQIEYGARLHDLGKLGVDMDVLRKAGPLSPQEFEKVKEHPVIGHRLLRSVAFLRPASAIVLYHHEWFNGEGYPEGLAGEEIPLGARITAIVEAWDTMTADRPYRKALSRHAAIAELRRYAGTQFDPRLVDVFLRVQERVAQDQPSVPA